MVSGMKLLIHYQSSTEEPLNLGMDKKFHHTLQGIFLRINAEIKVNLC